MKAEAGQMRGVQRAAERAGEFVRPIVVGKIFLQDRRKLAQRCPLDQRRRKLSAESGKCRFAGAGGPQLRVDQGRQPLAQQRQDADQASEAHQASSGRHAGSIRSAKRFACLSRPGRNFSGQVELGALRRNDRRRHQRLPGCIVLPGMGACRTSVIACALLALAARGSAADQEIRGGARAGGWVLRRLSTAASIAEGERSSPTRCSAIHNIGTAGGTEAIAASANGHCD